MPAWHRIVLVAAVLTGPCAATMGQNGEALLVVANPNLAAEDAALANVLDGLEYEFVLMQDAVVTAADAEGKAVVLISETVGSGNVASKFRDVAVPVIALEGFIQDDMNFTGLAQDIDFGFVADAGSVISATDAAHPIVGGLPAGPVQIYESSGTLQWGIPVPSATVVATMPSEPEQATLYVFDAGAELGEGTTAPARRAFYTIHSSATTNLTDTGTVLLANIVLWATGRESEIIPIEGGLTPFFTATPSSGYVPLTVSFDASGSTGPTQIVDYEWDFGDGADGSGVTVTHGYVTAGEYTATLTITDDQGASGSLAVPIFAGEPVSFDPHFTIPFAGVSPEVDGVKDQVWTDLAATLAIENVVNDAAPTDGADLSADVHVLYDAQYVYVFYEVADEDLQNDSEASWQDDAVDFYLDGGLQKCFMCYDADDGQFEFSWNSDVLTGNAAASRGENVSFAWQDVEGGYTIEARVPWENFGVDPVQGTVVGIEFMVNDDDGGGDARETKIAWFASEDNTFQYAHLMGNAELGAQAVSSEQDSELPDRFTIESLYPNPFNPQTTAVLGVREAGVHQLHVYDVLGSLLRTIEVSIAGPGRFEVPIDLADLASGVYLVSATHVASGQRATARALLVK